MDMHTPHQHVVFLTPARLEHDGDIDGDDKICLNTIFFEIQKHIDFKRMLIVSNDDLASIETAYYLGERFRMRRGTRHLLLDRTFWSRLEAEKIFFDIRNRMASDMSDIWVIVGSPSYLLYVFMILLPPSFEICDRLDAIPSASCVAGFTFRSRDLEWVRGEAMSSF